ncbi:hypothetical protein [Ponticaulis sp.]|uniref:hypothetical protein n=1 Tax=Ponticaulis sp. TaxID=2020902 RepID=UPI0025E23CC4|nr:hypothetical protein [Ponticaulis sp.]
MTVSKQRDFHIATHSDCPCLEKLRANGLSLPVDRFVWIRSDDGHRTPFCTDCGHLVSAQ